MGLLPRLPFATDTSLPLRFARNQRQGPFRAQLMRSFVTEAKGGWDPEDKENEWHPGQWKFPKAHSVTTSGTNSFLKERRKQTKIEFSKESVLQKRTLCVAMAKLLCTTLTPARAMWPQAFPRNCKFALLAERLTAGCCSSVSVPPPSSYK